MKREESKSASVDFLRTTRGLVQFRTGGLSIAPRQADVSGTSGTSIASGSADLGLYLSLNAS